MVPRIKFNANEYKEILRSILGKNERCRHKQCDFTRPEHQCRLCLNVTASASPNKICSTHKKHVSRRFTPYLTRERDADGLKLNRQGQVKLGFDPLLLTDQKKWFADDAIRTAFLFMTPKASERRVDLCLHTPANGLDKVVKVPNAVVRLIILTTSRHWMLIVYNYESKEWLLYNSKESQYYTDYVLGVYNVAEIRNMNSLQQLNDNDCGAFAIYNALCLLYRKNFNKGAHEVRDFVIKFLASRGNVKF